MPRGFRQNQTRFPKPVPASLTAADLDDRIDRCWDAPDDESRHAALAEEGHLLAERFVLLGDEHYQALVSASSVADPEQRLDDMARAEHLFFTFDVSEASKRLLLLWRNVLLEWERSIVARIEGRATRQEVEVLAKASRAQLHKAADFLRETTIERERRRLRDDPVWREDRLYRFRLQDNPWPTYRAQLTALGTQMTELHAGFADREKITTVFTELREYVSALPTQLARDHAALITAVEQAIDIVRAPEATSVAKVSTSRLQQLEVVETVDARLETISQRAGAIIDKLPDRARLYTIGADGGLRLRDLYLEYLAGQWLSAELLPELQRGTRLMETAAAELGRTLVDIRNRVSLARELETPESAGPNETQTLDRLAKLLEGVSDRLQRQLPEIESVGERIVALADRELRLSRSYQADSPFLEVAFGSNVSRMRREQHLVFGKSVKWLRSRFSALLKRINVTFDTEELSTGEKIIRTIRSRRPMPANDAYTSVLSTRGFIGEAFHAGRDVELGRAATAIDAWKGGFRGSILVTGERYAGKTHFVELLAGRYFEQRVIRLRANRQIDFAGRRLEATGNLREALAFVRKHTSGQRLLVLVDDLELWSDRETSLAANADALREAIDTMGNRLMFVVTTSNWIIGHLHAATDLAGAFQVRINLDYMREQDFVATVLTRHAATHMSVVDEDGRAMNARALRRYAREIHGVARGNVGDGLRRWARSMHIIDTTTVRNVEQSNYPLPRFLDANTGVLLADVKQQRYTNEYDLRRRFGPAFDREFRPVLQRLIGLDILQRHRTGTLAINSVVSNEIARLLERDGYLLATGAELKDLA